MKLVTDIGAWSASSSSFITPRSPISISTWCLPESSSSSENSFKGSCWYTALLSRLSPPALSAADDGSVVPSFALSLEPHPTKLVMHKSTASIMLNMPFFFLIIKIFLLIVTVIFCLFHFYYYTQNEPPQKAAAHFFTYFYFCTGSAFYPYQLPGSCKPVLYLFNF